MKTLIRKLRSLARKGGPALLLAALPLQAADPTPATYYETTGTVTSPTNLIAASTTLTNSATAGIIPCSTADNVALMFRSRNTNAVDAATVTLKFSRSIDGSIFETTPGISWSPATLATTATNYCYTNIATGGARYIKFETLQNSSTGALGSVELTYGTKRTQVRTSWLFTGRETLACFVNESIPLGAPFRSFESDWHSFQRIAEIGHVSVVLPDRKLRPMAWTGRQSRLLTRL